MMLQRPLLPFKIQLISGNNALELPFNGHSLLFSGHFECLRLLTHKYLQIFRIHASSFALWHRLSVLNLPLNRNLARILGVQSKMSLAAPTS